MGSVKHRYGYAADWLKFVQSERIIAVIRSNDVREGRKMAQAVAAGGIKLIEITANSDRPWELIASLRADLPNCSIGTGTILTLDDARNAIDCGAEYMFTPHVNLSLIKAALDAEVPIIPGALTPTEIITAWQSGATAVKVFPIQAVGGVSYLQVLQGPIGQIPLIPTGGVTVANAGDLLEAGAVAVGLAGSLFSPTDLRQENWQNITNLASNLVDRLNQIESMTNYGK